MSVPGIGPIISSAMMAAIGTGDAFSKGRDFAAWLGLVPKQISTGDRTILGKISKRGNRYLRVLFVQAAWVVLIKPKNPLDLVEPAGRRCGCWPTSPIPDRRRRASAATYGVDVRNTPIATALQWADSTASRLYEAAATSS
jgi:hypothetical protein